MGEVTRGGFGRWTFSAIVIAIAGLVAVQSVVHLVLTVGLGRLDTILDLGAAPTGFPTSSDRRTSRPGLPGPSTWPGATPAPGAPQQASRQVSSPR